MADYRMVYLRDRISKNLGVQEHPEALETLMKERHDEFQAFLDDEVSDISEMEKIILYIYRTFYDRLVEREAVTIEKGIMHNCFLLLNTQNCCFPRTCSSKNYDATTTH